MDCQIDGGREEEEEKGRDRKKSHKNIGTNRADY